MYQPHPHHLLPSTTPHAILLLRQFIWPMCVVPSVKVIILKPYYVLLLDDTRCNLYFLIIFSMLSCFFNIAIMVLSISNLIILCVTFEVMVLIMRQWQCLALTDVRSAHSGFADGIHRHRSSVNLSDTSHTHTCTAFFQVGCLLCGCLHLISHMFWLPYCIICCM